MPRTPDICPTFIPQADKITALIEQYGETLKTFEVEGTPALAQELDRLKAEILALKEDINKTLKPLGYDLDNPPPALESPDEIDAKLKELGSPAVFDRSIENGVIKLEIDQKTMESLRTYDTAIDVYKEADSTDTFIRNNETKFMPWTQPTNSAFDVLVLSHGETTPAQRDTLVTHMGTLGYRPLTFTELIALGIKRPDLNTRGEFLNTIKKQALDDEL